MILIYHEVIIISSLLVLRQLQYDQDLLDVLYLHPLQDDPYHHFYLSSLKLPKISYYCDLKY